MNGFLLKELVCFLQSVTGFYVVVNCFQIIIH